MTARARRVRIDLAYDGTAYHGWQIQPGRPTIQGVLEEALTTLAAGTPVRVRGAGRTDAGVHARGQVADAFLEFPGDDARLLKALSGLLPSDVRPLGVRSMHEGFHARRDAVSKTYRYALDLSPCGDPFVARFALHWRAPLDPGAIREGAGRLLGTRDWSGFAAASCEIEDRVRTLSEARFESAGREASFVFTADGFLTHMVRNLVGTLLDVGRGALAVEAVGRILESGDRTLAGPTAPAHGLVLERVVYDGGAADADGP